MTARELIQDDIFIELLRKVLANKDFSETDKVDAFYLMLKKIRWNFSGSARIAPGYDYFKTYRGYASTFLLYQRRLNDLNYDTGRLIEIAKTEHQKNVIRSSHALLLSVMLSTSSKIGNTSLDYNYIQKSQVPDIYLHHLSLAVVLTRDYRSAIALGRLLSAGKYLSEEGSEDILCCLGIFDADETKELIKGFILSKEKSSFDCSIETSVLILKQRLNAEEFDSFLNQVLQSNKDFGKRLHEMKQAGFKDSISKVNSKGFIKTWDDFDLTIYDDGIAISYKDIFADFLPADN